MNKRNLILALSMALVMLSCKNAAYYTSKGNKNMGEGNYEGAIQNFQMAIDKGASKSEINFKLGESYRLSNRLAESGDYYKAAIENGSAEESAQVFYGMSLKSNGKYEEAIKQLKEYSKKGRSRNWTKYAKYEAKNIAKIEDLPFLKSNFTAENFTQINSNAEDYAPTVVGDEIFFTSSRGEGKVYGGTGMGFSDIYISSMDGMNIQKVDEGLINLPEINEGTPAIHPEGNVMVFARANDGSKKGDKDLNLWVSTKDDNGNWGAPAKANITDETHWDGCPSWSPDGKYLYFSSNRKGGKGGLDIYRAKYADGNFIKPTNVGSKVNSFGNEMFPFVHEDGTLYFSSTGHVGFGGLDLFREHPDEKGKFKERAENLGKTINTVYDDFSMVYTDRFNGYFSSNRPNGMGSDDIYKFKEEIIPFYFLDLVVKGGVANVDHASVTFMEDNEEVENNFTSDLGHYKHQLHKDGHYEIKVEKDSFFTATLTFNLDRDEIMKNEKNEDGDYIIKEVVNLKKIGEKESYDVKELGYDVRDILYDVSEWTIRPDAATELDKLIQFLQENPGISIELGSHTDSRDTDAKNMTLSQKRAESAVNYIVENGNIIKERITAKGYGESRLLNRCGNGVNCSDEEHQANRRTEIKVLGVEAVNADKFEAYKKAQEEARIEAEREARHDLMEEEYLMIEELKAEVEAMEKKKIEVGTPEFEYYTKKKTKLDELKEHFKELEAEEEADKESQKSQEVVESDEYKEMQKQLQEMKEMMEKMQKMQKDDK